MDGKVEPLQASSEGYVVVQGRLGKRRLETREFSASQLYPDTISATILLDLAGVMAHEVAS